MELTKNDIKMMQGLSVMAMLCLHLFDRYDYAGIYTPILYIKGILLSFYFGQISDFCVMGFAFCSGYAHMAQYSEKRFSYKRRMVGVLNIYIVYWLIMLTWFLGRMIIGSASDIVGDASLFWENMSGVNTTYNGAAWYLFTYMVIVCVSPFLLKAVKRYNSSYVILSALVVYVTAYYVRFEMGTDNQFLLQFGKFGMTLFEYQLGVLCYEKRVFSKLLKIMENLRCSIIYIVSILVLFAMLLFHTLVVGNVIIAPFTGFVILVLFKLWNKPKGMEHFFLMIGNHSTNIWLTHMYFRSYAYAMEYPIFIYSFMLIITLVASSCINVVSIPIKKRVQKVLLRDEEYV